MKLLFCSEPTCGDLVRLFGWPRSCRCGRSYGRYLNESEVEISGPASVVGIPNGEFEDAYRKHAALGLGSGPARAFFLPDRCSTVRKVA